MLESCGALRRGLIFWRCEKRPVPLARWVSYNPEISLALHFGRVVKRDLWHFLRLALIVINLRLLTDRSLHGCFGRLCVTDTPLLVRVVMRMLRSLAFSRFRLLLILENFGKDSRSERVINKRLFFVHESRNDFPHVVYLRKSFEEWYHFQQAPVISVIVPAEDRHRVLWVEVVGVGAIVHDDQVLHGSADQRHIFYVGALIAETVVSVQTKRNVSVLIDKVNERISVDAHTCRVDNKFINFRHSLQKLLDTWPDEHIHLDRPALDHDPHLEVTLTACLARLQLRNRELTVDEGLIKVENESLAASVLRLLLIW